jgi:gas vesicle protein
MTDYERSGDYQQSDRSPVGFAMTFLLIGLGAGALLGLLFAPKSGKQLRRTLRRRYEDARDVIEDLGDQASEVIDKGAEWASTAKDKVAPLGKVIRRRI